MNKNLFVTVWFYLIVVLKENINTQNISTVKARTVYPGEKSREEVGESRYFPPFLRDIIYAAL